MGKIERLNRTLHDIYAATATSLTGYPRRWDISPTAILRNSETCVVEQSAEQELYDLPDSCRTYHCNSIRLYDLKDVKIVGTEGYVYSADGKLFQDCPSIKKQRADKIRRPLPIANQKIKEPFFHLIGSDIENRAHFITQHIPRFLAARDWIRNAGGCKILISSIHYRWQLDYLQGVGIREEDVIYASPGTIKAKRIFYVPMWYDESYLINPDIYAQMSQLYESYARSLAFATQKIGNPVFISRRDVRGRRLLNEDEMIEICKKNFPDLLVLELSRLSFVEQLRIFSSAPWIITAQGQALNVLGICRGSKVLILEAGNKLKGNKGWDHNFLNYGRSCGHLCARLLSGIPCLQNKDWLFPKEVFAGQLNRAVSIMNRVEGKS